MKIIDKLKSKQLIEHIDYLENLNLNYNQITSKQLVLNDPKCIETIGHLHEIITSKRDDLIKKGENELVDWQIVVEKKCFNLFPKLIIAFSSTLSVSAPNHILLLSYLIQTLNVIFTKSARFCQKFNLSKKGLYSLSSLLSVNVNADINENDNSALLVLLVANLNILSRYSEQSLAKWKQLRLIESLMNVLSREPRLKRTVYQIIINVAHNESEWLVNF